MDIGFSVIEKFKSKQEAKDVLMASFSNTIEQALDEIYSLETKKVSFNLSLTRQNNIVIVPIDFKITKG